MYTAPALESTEDLNQDRFETIVDMADHVFRAHADRAAFSCMGHTLSYREVEQYATRLAVWLRDHSGLQPGDRIAIQLPNLLQFPIAAFAAVRAGLVVVNTNPLYTPREMKHQFVDSDVRGVIILENFCQNLQDIVADTGITCVITTQVADMLPQPRRFLLNAGARYLKRMVPRWSIAGTHDWQHIMRTEASAMTRVDSGTDVALVLYTGGTTGPAKGAMLTHRNLLSNMMQMRQASRQLITDNNDIIVAPLPLYHTYAFMLHCMVCFYAGNHSVLIPNPRDLDDVVKTMQALPQINGLVGINTLFLALTQHKDIHTVDFSKMSFTGSGGMALTVRVAEEWQRVTGCQVYEGYGLTECSPVVSLNPPDGVRIGTVGRALADTQVKVVDEEGQDAGFHATGELWVRGPQVMKGYWNNPEATAETLTDDGWLKTGDYAEIDEDGYISIVDRKKDLIIVSGFNVFPSEVEEVVNSHPGVAESAVIGIPSEKSGETIKLFVVRRDEVLTREDLEAYCRENLTAYKVPREIVFVDDLPKSNVGKILRRELREQELAVRKK